MGRIYVLELKKICKTKMVFIAMAAALTAAIGFIFLVSSFESFRYADESGEIVKVTGREAIRRKTEAYKDIPTEMTPETIKEQYDFYVKMCKEYGDGEFSYDIPRDLYDRQVAMAEHNAGNMYAIFQTVQNPYFSALLDPPEAAAYEYYERWEEYIENYVWNSYPNNPQAAEQAMMMVQNIRTPFVSEYGAGVEAMDYIMLLQLILIIVSIIIMAPLFASDYQTGADDIQRCTKYGRIKYAVTKAGAALTIVSGIYVVSLATYILGINVMYGWKGLETSMQITGYIHSLMPYNTGEMQLFQAAGGLLALLALLSFTMFVSSKCKSPATSLGAAMIMFLAPMFLSMILNGSLADWLICILPSGGAGFNTGLWIEAAYKASFLNIGAFSFYAPSVILVMAAIWTIIFLPGAMVSYCRHEK